MRGRGSRGGGWNGQEAADSLCCPPGLSFHSYKWWGVEVILHSESLLYRTVYYLPIKKNKKSYTPNVTSAPWGNMGHSPVPWPGVLRGKPCKFISHPEEDVMILTEGAIQSEGREGSHIFELKMYSNQVGGLKQCEQTFA